MDSLYDRDLVRWAEEQGQALRAAADAGRNTPIDWENVAEEIETLGRSERNALASHIATVIEHLLKLEASPASERVAGWEETIARARRDISRRLKDSPSLRREVVSMIADETTDARSMVATSLRKHGEQPRRDLDAIAYTEEQVLGDWWPGEP